MKKITVMLGDFYHEPEWSKQAAALALRRMGLTQDDKVDYIAPNQLSAALKERPDLFILFKEDRLDPEGNPSATWMSAEDARQITAYVNEGGAWLAWHSGMAGYAKDSEYVDMLKGRFLHHPAQNTVRYIPENQGDAGISEPFEFWDEHYFVECREQETEVFLRSESPDGRSIAGWRHAYGQGKVCCLTPAHRLEGLTDDAFQQVLRHSIRWCLS